MKSVALLVLLCGGAFAQGKRFEITVAGLKLAGDSGQLSADGMDGEVVGNASVTLPARTDRTLVRHPGGGLVSGEEVVVTAHRISIQAGLLLKARGAVVITTRGERVDAREFDLFLKIGDGEVRGNVLLNGRTAQRPDVRQRPPYRFFPPDIQELPSGGRQK
jgi:hypothetical protein